jgi:uncharacterized protein (DUF302 family)
MTRALVLLLAVIALPAAADSMSDPGLVVKKSANSVAATLDKLESIVTKKGFTVFARIDHAAGAAKVGKTLRPTQLLIFGNPKVGTALMSSQQSAGLDLPIRVAAWEDAGGQVWIGYTAPAALAERHGITDRDPVIEKMTGALGKLTGAAAK